MSSSHLTLKAPEVYVYVLISHLTLKAPGVYVYVLISLNPQSA